MILLAGGTNTCQRTIFIVKQMPRNFCDYLSYMTGSHLFCLGSYVGSSDSESAGTFEDDDVLEDLFLFLG